METTYTVIAWICGIIVVLFIIRMLFPKTWVAELIDIVIDAIFDIWD